MHSLTFLPLTLLTLVSAQFPDELVGTWVSKSRSVVTGPEFYDPVADKFTEPKHAGIAYSFTSDGWFEQAYYRSIPNRVFTCDYTSPRTNSIRSNNTELPIRAHAMAARHLLPARQRLYHP